MECQSTESQLKTVKQNKNKEQKRENWNMEFIAFYMQSKEGKNNRDFRELMTIISDKYKDILLHTNCGLHEFNTQKNKIDSKILRLEQLELHLEKLKKHGEKLDEMGFSSNTNGTEKDIYNSCHDLHQHLITFYQSCQMHFEVDAVIERYQRMKEEQEKKNSDYLNNKIMKTEEYLLQTKEKIKQLLL